MKTVASCARVPYVASCRRWCGEQKGNGESELWRPYVVERECGASDAVWDYRCSEQTARNGCAHTAAEGGRPCVRQRTAYRFRSEQWMKTVASCARVPYVASCRRWCGEQKGNGKSELWRPYVGVDKLHTTHRNFPALLCSFLTASAPEVERSP